MAQYVKTVLEVDASGAVAGFKKGANAVNQYEQALGGAGDSAGKAESRLAGMSASFNKNREAWDSLGSSAMVAGAAIAGGLGLAAKAAIDWESSWAGVKKTVGEGANLEKLESDLRGLTKVLPATHAEIAGVAEAAGQLGVAANDITEFTETAVALGESTNLSAEEAATGLAKISNVMGTMDEHGVEGIERMGSALVALGNNGASTEADILAMAQRIAGAGATIGASESDILALSNALSSVGVEAQVGGGAISRAMMKMNSAVVSGGEDLEAFAQIAGMSASQFAAAWRSDPVAAIGEFVSGLGRINDSGGDAAAALEGVGLAGTQNAQVFLSAAGASDMLTASLEQGATAWEANTALSKEAAQRYETDAAQIQMAMNTVNDAMIDIGGDIAPAVAAAADGIAGLAEAFSGLPGPVRQFITATAAVSGGALLLGGVAIKAVGFATDMADAFGKVGPAGEKAAGGLNRAGRAGRGLAKWGGYALGVAAVVTVLNSIEDAATPVPSSIEEITAALLDLENASDLTGINDEVFSNLNVATTGIDDLVGSYERLTNPSFFEGTADLIQKTGELVGLESDVSTLESAYARLGEALASMPAETAAAKFDIMVESLGGGKEVAKNLLELMPAYADSLTGAANASKMAADGAAGHADALSGEEQAAADAAEAMDELKNALDTLGGGFRAEQAAGRAVAESIASMNEAVASGEGGWAALSESMSQSASDALAFAAAQAEMGRGAGAISAGIAQTREAVIQAGIAAGKSRPFMEAYADSIGLIPDQVLTELRIAGVGEATARVAELDETIMLLNGKTVTVKEAGALVSQGRVKGLDMEIVGLDGKTVTVKEIGATASGDRVVLLDGKIQVLSGKTVDVQEQGAAASRQRVQELTGAIGGVHDKSVGVRANVSGESKVWSLKSAIDSLRSRDIYINNHVTTRRKVVDMGTLKAAYNADGGIHGRGPGGLTRQFANGGVASFAGQPPQIRAAGGAGVTWAEDGAGPWEAFISGHPAKAARSRSIWLETGKRLGLIQAMADGGVRHYTPAVTSGAATTTPAPSMTGLQVTGTLDTPWGPAQVRGIVKDEMTTQARTARVQRSVR